MNVHSTASSAHSVTNPRTFAEYGWVPTTEQQLEQLTVATPRMRRKLGPARGNRITRWVKAAGLERLFFTFALLSCCATVGCSGAEDTRPPAMSMTGDNGMGGEGPGTDFSCEESTSRDCTYKRYFASGAVTCSEGIQFCVDGAWSECFYLGDEDATVQKLEDGSP